MKWVELSIHTVREYVEPISELFRRYSDTSVVIEEEGDWDPDNLLQELSPPTSILVKAYLLQDDTIEKRYGMIDIGVRLISILHHMEDLQSRIIEEKEWETAWKAHFNVMKIGKHLVVKPTWQEYLSNGNDIVLELDPGLAFGTGYHPTTRMCLEQIELRVVPKMKVLDLGSGSGILSIAAAKLGASSVFALDIDETALKMMRTNARHNGVHEIVSPRLGTLPHSEALQNSFDLAVANVTANVVVKLAQSLAQVLKPCGVLVASGIIIDRQSEVEEALNGFFLVIDRLYEGDWVTLVAELQG
jgi:ribosomal protein L11 methyltransferase